MKYQFLIIILLVSGCAANNSKTNSNFNRLENQLSDLRAMQSENSTALEDLRLELRQLLGRVEQLEHGQNQVTDLRDDVASIKSRVPPPTIVPVDELEQDEALDLPEEVSETFKVALSKLRTASYTQASQLFREVLDRSMGEPWGANTLFWLAIANDGLGKPKEALQYYHECASEYPKHPRTPLALLRQGSILIRLGDSATAKLTFKKIIASFPRAKEAAVAKQRLADLGR